MSDKFSFLPRAVKLAIVGATIAGIMTSLAACSGPQQDVSNVETSAITQSAADPYTEVHSHSITDIMMGYFLAKTLSTGSSTSVAPTKKGVVKTKSSSRSGMFTRVRHHSHGG